MIRRRLLLLSTIILLVAGCAAPGLNQSQRVTSATATATRVRNSTLTTRTPQATATATATAVPTSTPTVIAPTDTPQPLPTATATAAPPVAAVAPANPQPEPPTTGGVAGGLLLAIDPTKYPAPTLLMPGDNVTSHVSQPIVHFAWSATPTDLMEFGQTPGCVSDATNFRRAFESYQLVIHSLDGARPDEVQWTDNNPSYDLNLTTVPAGRYSWKVNVVTLCESYVVGQRNDTHPLYSTRNNDPAYHKSTLQTSLVGVVSPWSATRIVNWVP